MASSPTESPTTFALQELIACWDQGYEALARGDLERVTALLTIADGQLRGLAAQDDDTPSESELRERAMTSRGRLEHGVRAGLQSVGQELGKVRQGSRALDGYKAPITDRIPRVERDA
ncbi:MAG: hypothetical protein NXI31_08205 [bacterium]|nr:hypothetical protein [bacterium]